MRSEPSFDAWTNPTTSPLSQPVVHQYHQKAHSAGWHSPVPYLFGGLAAMLGLIAFALLILACSYWKLSGYLDSTENNTTHDDNGEMSNMKQNMIKTATQQCSEVRLVVIMAGEEKPTFLATPINSSRAASSSSSSYGGGNLAKNEVEVREEKMESSDRTGRQRVEP